VARIKPRLNAEVNEWWICDAGRYGFRGIDDPSRLTAPRKREGDRAAETTWDDAIGTLARALQRYRPEEIGILASPQMSNEDLFVLERVVRLRGIRNVDFRVPPRAPGDQDDFLIRSDKNPNSRGAELSLAGPGAGGLDAGGILKAAAGKQIKLLWIFHHDLAQSAWPETERRAALEGAAMVVFQGSNGNAGSARAHLALPSAAHAEREGTFTNFQGRVQRFRAALSPLGDALPDWDILARLGRALGAGDHAFAAERAEQVFDALAASVPQFVGMSYRGLGDTGQMGKS
jgi:NADH-quinone oxidoreductase subunit G